METTIKTTLAKENSEMEKLEQSKKSQLRMISSSAARIRLKYARTEGSNELRETDAKKIRMYETHFPGFCYLRNGEYRKKTISNAISSSPDPVECSEKVKTILFTDNELDIYKTMCLHLLGTHIQNKNHIQRKDGRLCSYVKAQSIGTTAHTLQPISQRFGSHITESQTKYDKMLPRYILDVRILRHGPSISSMRMSDYESGSDEEVRKKRKQLVPIYINNEIRIIINSVMEALEAVESSKLQTLIDLASSPEELRNMLTRDDIQDYIIEMAGNPLIMKPTSYDYVMAHLMFDKIPEKGTLETVAQVLEVHDDSELKMSLQRIRKALLQRHVQLINCNIVSGKGLGLHDKQSSVENNYKVSTSSVNSNLRNLAFHSSGNIKPECSDIASAKTGFACEKENVNVTNTKRKPDLTVCINPEKPLHDSDDHNDSDESSVTTRCTRLPSTDSNKWDLHNLNNSQRILLGLKVASLKSRPINMHQFDGKKRIDLSEIINPIIRPHVADIDYKENSPANHTGNFSTPEKKGRKSHSRTSTIETGDLENLTRALLANLRLQISDSENKKRLNQFMARIP